MVKISSHAECASKGKEVMAAVLRVPCPSLLRGALHLLFLSFSFPR